MIQDKLNEYRWIRKNIEALTQTLCELEDKRHLQSPSMSFEPKGSSTSDKTGETASAILDLKALIAKKIEEGGKAIAKIEELIEMLPEREKYLFRLRYIRAQNWESICVDMNYSWQHTHKIHKRGLRILKEATKCD